MLVWLCHTKAIYAHHARPALRQVMLKHSVSVAETL